LSELTEHGDTLGKWRYPNGTNGASETDHEEGEEVMPPNAKDDAAREELKKLEGTYVMVSSEAKGDNLPETTIKNAKLTFEGNKHTVKVGENTFIGTQKVDTTKKPKEIDMTDTEGPFKGKTLLGIYKLENGEYTACFAPPGKERPKEFTTKSGTGEFIHVWKKQKE